MTRQFLDHEVGTRLLKGLDLVVLTASTFVLCIVLGVDANAASPALAGSFSLTLAFLCVFLTRGFGLYDSKQLRRLSSGLLKTSLIWAIVGLSAGVAMGLAGLQLAHSWFGMWLLAAGSSILVSRSAVWLGLRRAPNTGQSRNRVVIVGGGKAAEDAINTLEKSTGLDVQVLGLFDDRYDKRSPASVRKYKKLGTIADLAAYARVNQVDLAIVAIPLSAEQRLLQILKRIWELPIDIRVSGQQGELRLSPQAYTYLGNLPLLAVFDRPLNSWNQFLKDTLDRVIALFALITLSPVMLAVAIAVKLESQGPILFKQNRYGFNNELIGVYKFRSMFVSSADPAAAKLVTKGDLRVTKVGRIIRKSSLDELPQLFNVLMGQLSLVGPRPHATQAKAAGGLYDEVVEGYFARHKVKPGITGWAQINGWRGETDTLEKIEQRVKHDLEYIDKWSLGFDLYILMKTPFALLKTENAY